MSDEDSMELDSIVAENCLRCSGDGATGKLLVCSVVGCPIAIHEDCMCIKPETDEKGRFYCPYCAHKRAVVCAERLRRKALRAKEVLSMFIDSCRSSVSVNGGKGSSGKEGSKVGADGGEEGRGEGVAAGIGGFRGEMRVGRGVDGGESEDQSMEVEENVHREMDENARKGNSDQQCVSERREFDERNEDDAVDGIDRGDGGSEENGGKSPEVPMEVAIDETVVPESGDFQNGAIVLRKRRYKQRAQKMVQVQHAIPVRIVDSPSTKSSSCQTDAVEEGAEKQSGKDTSSECRKVSESDQNEKATNPSKKSRKGLELNLNEKVTTSCFELREVPGSNQTEKATTSLSSQSREIREPNQNGKDTTAFSKSRKDTDSNKNITISSTAPIKVPESKSEELNFGYAKRKRFHWTAEELEMLKEGVLLFSAQVNKNVPWRKILEHGKDVFHETRTPDNLKDKWKLLSREASIKKQT